jgi:dTDP-4-dehydrorhamnose reductase
MRAIVVGIDGSIGKALGDALAARGEQVVGTTRRRERVGGNTIYLDLDEPEPARVSLPEADVAFFCAGVTSFSECRLRPEIARRVNAAGPAAIAARLVERGTRVVLLSTSAVLDCRVPHMAADRPRRAASVYGRTKAAAEEAFLALGHSAAVLRLTKVLTPGMKRFAEWIGKLTQGKEMHVPDDLRFCPVALEHVVRASLAIADHSQEGILQVSGAADISYADAARHVARRLGVSSSLIVVSSAADLGIHAEEVTAYTSLDATRLTAICGFAPPEPLVVVDAVIEPMIAAVRQSAVHGC